MALRAVFTNKTENANKQHRSSFVFPAAWLNDNRTNRRPPTLDCVRVRGRIYYAALLLLQRWNAAVGVSTTRWRTAPRRRRRGGWRRRRRSWPTPGREAGEGRRRRRGVPAGQAVVAGEEGAAPWRRRWRRRRGRSVNAGAVSHAAAAESGRRRWC